MLVLNNNNMYLLTDSGKGGGLGMVMGDNSDINLPLDTSVICDS